MEIKKIKKPKINPLKKAYYKLKYSEYQEINRLINNFNKIENRSLKIETANEFLLKIDEIRIRSREFVYPKFNKELRRKMHEIESRTDALTSLINERIENDPQFKENHEKKISENLARADSFLKKNPDRKVFNRDSIKLKNFMITNEKLNEFDFIGFPIPKNTPDIVDITPTKANCCFCTVSALTGLTTAEMSLKTHAYPKGKGLNSKEVIELFIANGHHKVKKVNISKLEEVLSFLNKNMVNGTAVGFEYQYRDKTNRLRGHVFTVRNENGNLIAYDYKRKGNYTHKKENLNSMIKLGTATGFSVYFKEAKPKMGYKASVQEELKRKVQNPYKTIPKFTV